MTSRGSDDEEPRRPHRLRPVSLTGVSLGILLSCLSVTPSLVPRAWWAQGLLSALCLVLGYAVGAFLGWAYRALHLRSPGPRARRIAWVVVGVLGPLALLVSGWLGRRWQVDQHELLDMDTSVTPLWVVAWVLGLVIAVLLLAAGRGIVWVGRRLARGLGRLLPVRVAAVAAVVITAVVTWYAVSGLLVDQALPAADAVFDGRNDDDKPGVVNPESPYRSGGPSSEVSWEDIGREGRQFIWQGQTAESIADVTDAKDAVEPVRAFVGLRSADTARERAAIAVAELRRLGGFDRRVIAVAGGTGSGWINPQVAAALEFAAHGDVATVSMQYSYLPSWMSFLVDRERAQDNAEELITALRVELATIPEDRRPELYVFGESLGAYSTDSAFTSVEDMATTTNGGLLVGPPSFDPTWTRVQRLRSPESPSWQPLYRDGAFTRVASTDAEITDPSLTWQSDSRIVYLVNPSDPITAWTADWSEWLDPRGPDVSPRVVPWPVVGPLQTTIDQLGANGTPPGHGHRYDETVVTAWSEVLGGAGLPEDEVAAIRDAVGQIGDPKEPSPG